MKNYIKIFSIASIAMSCLFGLNSQAATILLQDDFSTDHGTSPTVADPERAFRVYETEIDDGWLRRFGNTTTYPNDPVPGVGGDATGDPGSWYITNGRVENADTTVDDGWQGSPSESALVQVFSNPVAGSSGDIFLNLSFDYNVASGDTLYAHFWAITGTPDFDGEFISNMEGSNNGNVDGGGGNSAELTEYNVKDGESSATQIGLSTDAISGALTGSGTFTTQTTFSSLGIPGVSVAGDIDYFYIAFTKNEDGLAGTTWVDNLSITSSPTPEPGTLGLFGLGALILSATRRRRLIA